MGGGGDRECTGVGIGEGMESSVISHVSRVACTFEEVPEGSGAPKGVTVMVYGEPNGASDVLFLGFPQILACGVASGAYTHLRAHETVLDPVCRLPLEKKNNNNNIALTQ